MHVAGNFQWDNTDCENARIRVYEAEFATDYVSSWFRKFAQEGKNYVRIVAKTNRHLSALPRRKLTFTARIVSRYLLPAFIATLSYRSNIECTRCHKARVETSPAISHVIMCHRMGCNG